MMLGPAFKGQIVVMESLSSLPSGKTLPDITPSEAPKIPDGLRQRFKPFGWGKPACVVKTKLNK